MRAYIMKLTHNKCKSCNSDYLIKKTEYTYYCNGCKVRYKKVSKRLILDKQVKAMHIDKRYIFLKSDKKKIELEEAKTSNEISDDTKKRLWRLAKEETLADYNKILDDPDVSIDEKNEISDMLVLYNRFGSATAFSRKATELYKKYITEEENNLKQTNK